MYLGTPRKISMAYRAQNTYSQSLGKQWPFGYLDTMCTPKACSSNPGKCMLTCGTHWVPTKSLGIFATQIDKSSIYPQRTKVLKRPVPNPWRSFKPNAQKDISVHISLPQDVCGQAWTYVEVQTPEICTTIPDTIRLRKVGVFLRNNWQNKTKINFNLFWYRIGLRNPCNYFFHTLGVSVFLNSVCHVLWETLLKTQSSHVCSNCPISQSVCHILWGNPRYTLSMHPTLRLTSVDEGERKRSW